MSKQDGAVGSILPTANIFLCYVPGPSALWKIDLYTVHAAFIINSYG